MSAIDTHIGARLQRERNRHRLSISELALLTRISAARLESFESGGERIRAPELYALSAALKVPVAVFFAFNDNDNASNIPLPS